MLSFGNQPGQVRFSDLTESSGILRQGQTWGLSVFDFNRDGLPDIYQNNHQQKPVSLFLNQGDGTFVDITAEVFPRRFPGDFHGAIGLDYDNDGDLEIFQGGGGDQRADDDNPNKSNRFLIQEDGQLIERAEELGIRFPLGRSRMPAAFDFNDDGRLDILYTGPRRPDGQAFPTIFLQDNEGFTNLGTETGLSSNVPNGTFGILANVTGDARQELVYVGRSPKVQIYDTSKLPLREISGLIPPKLLSEVNVIKDIAVADFNGDTHQDLLIVQQGTGSSGYRLDDSKRGRAHLEGQGGVQELIFKNAGKLFLNFDRDPDLKLPPFFLKDRTIRLKDIFIGTRKLNPKSLDFRLNPNKIAHQGIPDLTPGTDFGVFVGFDTRRNEWRIQVSDQNSSKYNFLFETERPNAQITPRGFNLNFTAKPDILLTYNPDLEQFVDSTEFSGLDRINTASRNVVAEDFDNDGDRDIFLVATANTQNLPDVLYENLGNGQFVKVPGAAGAAGIREGIGDTAVVADFDVNGFIDIVVTNGDVFGPDRNFWLDGTNRIFKNEGNDNHWIQIDLEGTQSNRDGIGAKVYVTTPDGKRQVRDQNGGVHNRGKNFDRLHFGIGEQTIISSLEVVWANGNTQTFQNVEPDRVILLKENRSKITTLFGDNPDSKVIIGTPQGDRLIGTAENNVVQGRGGNDRLKGLNGDDTLLGGIGNDILVGGKGQDVLNGGPGSDRYVFTSPNHGRDRIVSFASDLDDIYISQTGFSRGLRQGRLSNHRFMLGNRAQDTGDRFIYDRNQGQLFFDPDGNGDQKARLLATFDEHPMLGSKHIVVF